MHEVIRSRHSFIECSVLSAIEYYCKLLLIIRCTVSVVIRNIIYNKVVSTFRYRECQVFCLKDLMVLPYIGSFRCCYCYFFTECSSRCSCCCCSCRRFSYGSVITVLYRVRYLGILVYTIHFNCTCC